MSMEQYFLASAGLTLAARLESPPEDYQNPALWIVELRRGDRRIWRGNYTMGSAHRRFKMTKSCGHVCEEFFTRKTAETEFEKVKRRIIGRRGVSVFDDEFMQKFSEPTPPDIAGVFSSLISDASCVASGETIGEFARELGYTDIEECSQAYDGCKAEFDALVAAGFDLENCAQLMQDF